MALCWLAQEQTEMPWYTAKQMRENGQKQRHRQKRDFAVVDVSTTPSRKIHAIHVNNFYHLCACAIRENDAADRVETSFDISENNSTKNQGQLDTQQHKIYLVNKWFEGLLDWMRPNF